MFGTSLPEVIIRLIEKRDLPSLEWGGEYTHFRRLFAEAYQQAEMGNAVLWMAEIDVLGLVGQLFVQLRSNDREIADGVHVAYIHGFRVKPAFQGQGIGTHLIYVAENDLIQRGFSRVTLNVGKDNMKARQLYERLGYRIVKAIAGQWSYVDHMGVPRKVSEPGWRMIKTLY